MKVLVTAFDAFGGERTNTSLEAARLLPARLDKLEIATAILPTSYARSLAALGAAIARVEPALVLCVGEAWDRTQLSVERVAVNVQDARIPDNDGAQPVDTPVVPGGPAAYLATLPVRAMVGALRAAELPVELSMSAGTFVCNHAFYGLMHLEATGTHRFRGGFLHVPRPKQEAGAPPMTLDDIVRGIVICLEVAYPGR